MERTPYSDQRQGERDLLAEAMLEGPACGLLLLPLLLLLPHVVGVVRAWR